MGMSSAQMGLMMLATQRPMGLGSGQSSGGAADPLRARRSKAAQASGRSRSAHGNPAGLAASYFNRTIPHSPYPQSYYNRQNRYYP
jgi:hypothetical protein